MKTIKYITVLAICLAAALLTSCIKEEVGPAQIATVEVRLTRAGEASTTQQGDQIQDIMLWAFDASNNYECVGWRTFTPDAPTYKTISVHLPVRMCGANGGIYRVVAVINKSLFTDGSGNIIPLDSNTTYEQLAGGRFVSESFMNSTISESSNPATPAAMPITHWCAVAVNQHNLHSENNCAQAPLKVFRTVAKTQFSIARTSDFNLEVKELSLHSNAMPEEGMILSAVHADELELMTASPAWFGSNAPAASTASSIDMITTPVTVTTAVNAQQLIGARFIYENSESCSYASDGKGIPTGDGYYYKITYSVDGGADITRYVGINQAIVRNHDYQVQAKVRADGQIQLSYNVAEWDEVEWNIDFANPVHSMLLTAPTTLAPAPDKAPTLYYDNANPEAGAFVGYFKMDSPTGVTWKPTLSNVSADDFEVKVYSNLDAEGNEIAEGYTREIAGSVEAKANVWYKIVVIATSADTIGEYPKLGITHRPAWNPGVDPLIIINKGSQHNGLYYSFDDWSVPEQDQPDVFWISIKQVAKP